MVASAIGGAIANMGMLFLKSRTTQGRHIALGRIFIVGVGSSFAFLVAPYVDILVGFGLGTAIGRIFQERSECGPIYCMVGL